MWAGVSPVGCSRLWRAPKAHAWVCSLGVKRRLPAYGAASDPKYAKQARRINHARQAGAAPGPYTSHSHDFGILAQLPHSHDHLRRLALLRSLALLLGLHLLRPHRASGVRVGQPRVRDEVVGEVVADLRPEERHQARLHGEDQPLRPVRLGAHHQHHDAHDGDVEERELLQHPRDPHQPKGLGVAGQRGPAARQHCWVSRPAPTRHGGRKKQQHVDHRGRDGEDREEDESDKPGRLPVAGPRGELAQALPDAHLGARELLDAHAHDHRPQHRAERAPGLEEALRVDAERHARPGEAQDQQGHEGAEEQGHEAGQRGGPPDPGAAARAAARPGRLRPLRQRRHPQAQGRHGGAHAEDREARKAHVQLRQGAHRRGVVEGAEQVEEEDVREHVGGGPLGDGLQQVHAAPRPHDLRRRPAAPELAEDQHRELHRGDDHGVEDDQSGAEVRLVLPQLLDEGDHRLRAVPHAHDAVHSREVVAEERAEEPRDQEAVAQGEARQHPEGRARLPAAAVLARRGAGEPPRLQLLRRVDEQAEAADQAERRPREGVHYGLGVASEHADDVGLLLRERAARPKRRHVRGG
mmetsp:Transcript_71673/g.154685  ORF Transcript_71673/g.154685 Transcript_71673/m.154685 type:complete len:581 (-) Transcript_71673:84-1826(-)